MLKYLVSASTALGDTAKTSIGSITLPQGTKNIVGVWGYAVGGAGNTTLENVTGILELESPDINLQPCQIPLECTALTGTGMSSFTPKVWPLGVPCQGKVTITGYMTLDLAQTIGNTGRWGIVVEV